MTDAQSKVVAATPPIERLELGPKTTPPTVPLFAVGPWLWGTLAAALTVLAALTGLVLMAFYQPTVAGAAISLADLRHLSSFAIWRDAHYWLAQALLVAAWAHLLRIYMAGSYRRRLGWTMTVALLAWAIAMAWTGSLLTAEVGVWSAAEDHPSVTSGTSNPSIAMAPADNLSDASLLRVYLAHCLLLPALAGGLVVQWRQRRKKRHEMTRNRHGEGSTA